MLFYLSKLWIQEKMTLFFVHFICVFFLGFSSFSYLFILSLFYYQHIISIKKGVCLFASCVESLGIFYCCALSFLKRRAIASISKPRYQWLTFHVWSPVVQVCIYAPTPVIYGDYAHLYGFYGTGCELFRVLDYRWCPVFSQFWLQKGLINTLIHSKFNIIFNNNVLTSSTIPIRTWGRRLFNWTK